MPVTGFGWCLIASCCQVGGVLRSICEQIFDDAMYDATSSRKKVFTVTLDYAKSKLENSL